MKKVMVFSLFILLLTGCSFQTGDGLLALPKLPQEYVELQSQYDEILKQGATFASVKTGSNRQSVQLSDLDADGENEVISFFRRPDGMFAVYIHKKNQTTYEQVGVLEGLGKNIKSVDYITVNENGQQALAVSWELEETTQAGMSVYSITNGTATRLIDFQYLDYTILDIDLDARDEIVAVTRSLSKARSAKSTDKNNVAMMYRFSDDGLVEITQVALSVESDKVVNMTKGGTASGRKGVFIDSATHSNQYVTDIITYDGQALYNESMNSASTSADATMRHINVFSTDIDGDGIIEVPTAEMFLGYTDPFSPDTRWHIVWQKVKQGKAVSGGIDTFYNATEGFYMVMPDRWSNRVSVAVSTEAGVSRTSFFIPQQIGKGKYAMSQNEQNTLLSIYVFTGDTSNVLERNPDLQVLKQTDTVTYGYKLYETEFSSIAPTNEEIIQGIKFIKNDWVREGTWS